MKKNTLQPLLTAARWIETLYLLTFFLIIYLRTLPQETIKVWTVGWVDVSFMLLPLFIIKNILVGVYNNGQLTSSQKMWLVVRCVVYILLAIYSYPLVLNA